MRTGSCWTLAIALIVACAAGGGARRLGAPRRAFVPISLNTAKALLGPNPTREQLWYHWGSAGRVFEKASVTWLGPLIIAYLNNLSYLGGLEATVLGSLTASYFVWGPALASLSRGALRVARSSSAALFFGHVSSVEESMGDGSVRVLELVIDDGTPRLSFVVWAPWKPEYDSIRVGMAARLLVLRTGLGQRAETSLVSECYLPDARLYFGEYPDLNRDEFEALLAQLADDAPDRLARGRELTGPELDLELELDADGNDE
ncbi:hypothetical protein KFE25_003881 [Diacronema lutheri]|uniref:Uncharacterized protein n=2 Tax=Diacronema lutheri TaxID=2081491 RepID=A0A8J5XBM6_DIALT|nr:hypothetical protein KFE25_003881 [Diacronema lutheri]